jgi:hypothetical protein
VLEGVEVALRRAGAGAAATAPGRRFEVCHQVMVAAGRRGAEGGSGSAT